MPTEREKMLAGEFYKANDPELVNLRDRARDLCARFNAVPHSDPDRRHQLLDELLGSVNPSLWIEPPFFCDYGLHITVGQDVFFNFNCVILDGGAVTLGDYVMCGPGVQIYTATHPLDIATRRIAVYAKPVTIDNDVWIGGGAIILPGVTIGPRSVIGAGSVVSRDIPADVFAAGNPCRVIRAIDNSSDAS